MAAGSELFFKDLQSEGFELYFESNDDFLNNCNEDFYFSSEIQKKLKHNYEMVKNLYKEKTAIKFFYMKHLKDIFPKEILNIRIN